jgi:hypothetical protein
MKQLLIIAALAFWGIAARPVHGQQATLVVPPFEIRGAQMEAEALNNLRDSLVNAFINTERFQVLDRNASSGFTQLGGAQRADCIVRVMVMYFGEYNLMKAQIVDIKTARSLSTAEMEFSGEQDAYGKMEEFVNDILQGIDLKE